jgi:hypothetical protein
MLTYCLLTNRFIIVVARACLALKGRTDLNLKIVFELSQTSKVFPRFIVFCN